MFEPEVMSEIQLQEAAYEISKVILLLQNENPLPQTGTLGFTMGTAVALGNIASIYVAGASRAQRKQFLRIILECVEDSFKDPFVSGTLNEQETMQ